MSVPSLSAKTLRKVRWVQELGLVASIGGFAWTLALGHFATALIDAVLIVFWLAMICLQTYLINRREALDRPRPDYSLIAAMEREVYGEKFAHEGSPQAVRKALIAAADNPRSRALVAGAQAEERRRQAQTFEDDRRAMREFAAASRRRREVCALHREGVTIQQIAEQMGMSTRSVRAVILYNDPEHRSNLRWERPS